MVLSIVWSSEVVNESSEPGYDLGKVGSGIDTTCLDGTVAFSL